MNKAEGVAIKDYIDTMFKLASAGVQEQFAAVCKEVQTAERVLEVRLESMNKFREAMTEQQKLFMTKAEYLLAHKPLDDGMKEARRFMDMHQGRATQNQVLVAYILAILSMLIGIVLHFTK